MGIRDSAALLDWIRKFGGSAYLSHRHLVCIIDNLEEGSLAPGQPYGRHEFRRVQRGVIDHVVDNVERRRVRADRAKRATRPSLGHLVDGNVKFLQRPLY